MPVGQAGVTINGSRSFVYNNFMTLAVAPSPPPSNYRALQIFGLNRPVLDPVEEIKQLAASSTVTPEPFTLARLGCGLVRVAGIARRRRRPEI